MRKQQFKDVARLTLVAIAIGAAISAVNKANAGTIKSSRSELSVRQDEEQQRSATDQPSFSNEELEYFERHIRPILIEHCYECHSTTSEDLYGGLLLDSRDGIREGGDSGSAVVPGDSAGSLLMEALRYESFEMPPEAKLDDETIARFEHWIEMGAADPREATAVTETTTPSTIDFEAGRSYWAFQNPRQYQQPTVSDPQWVRRKIDAFVLAKLDETSLRPNERASKTALIRRVTFDLTGLPPTPQDVEAFLEDSSENAYEKVVERLLASPAYGERWAQLWLDVARYAEDQAHIVGNNKELFFPNAYLYRDWLIAAFNNDMPYDQFLLNQLAADQLESELSTAPVSLGFLGLGPKYYRRNSPEVMADEWEDRVDTVSRGLLGLTVACARCHDHKYDPISTEDYYALAGVFAGTEMYNMPLQPDAELKGDGNAKNPDESIHIVREGEPKDIPVMIRGDVSNPGEIVPRRFLTVLSDQESPAFQIGSGRLELAQAIASPDNPLTARVLVNRVWAAYFGEALVRTPSNFGALGERPTHPRLLDDLASRFMENGWSLKWLHQEIVLSSTYLQSSEISESKFELDPTNRLLWRVARKRLTIEAWRDAILFATGRLDDRVGGPSIDPADPAETRRTVYSSRSRFQLNPMLALFDAPDPNAHAAQRVETITPLQKLFVLNSPFMIEQATYLVDRLIAEVGDDNTARIDFAYRVLYGREATDSERNIGTAYLEADMTRQGWINYAQILLATNELLIID